MGLFSFNFLRSREAREPKLPLYKELAPSRRRTQTRSPTKERYSDSEDSSDESDDDLTDSDSEFDSSPSSGSSRQTSGSNASAVALMRNKRLPPPAPAVRRPMRKFLYRLPNKVIRWLCLGMISSIVIFIFALVRASQVENRRLAEVTPDQKPVAPPPWEDFEFLTRYYGGIKTLVSISKNEPQYPRLEDEGPYNATKAQEAAAEKAASGASIASAETHEVPSSIPFGQHPGAILPKPGHDSIKECFIDAKGKVRIPSVRYLAGRTHGFPEHVMGSFDIFSLPDDICFERFGRYGPYGYGYSIRTGGLGLGDHGDTEGSDEVWEEIERVDWRTVDWADVQGRCYQANAARYKALEPRPQVPHGFYIGEGSLGTVQKRAARSGNETTQMVKTVKPAAATSSNTNGKPKAKPSSPEQEEEKTLTSETMDRTAVVLRCWDEFVWRQEDILNLRALISELSLASGGRYDVHLLVQVRNDAHHPIWADEEEYQRRINDTIPAEFRSISTLWSETQMLAVYQGLVDLWTRGPDLPLHGSYRGLQMAMQLFAHHHPEYAHFWQWEMDIRYTGHYLDLLSKLEGWAKEQPRKGLWERNARFYVPSIHGTWDDFKQMVRVQTEHGTGTPSADKIWENLPGVKPPPTVTAARKGGKVSGEESVWGPLRPADEADWLDHEEDPVPPTSYERDRYEWGVGEEADLISLSPIFDPEGTTWGLADDITGYNESAGAQGGKPPRRAQIITASRMSRRLLTAMHRETAYKKHHAFPEMWPATVALHHGFKAVYAPHPIFVDRAWPTAYMERIMNGGRNGASGGARTSVYGDREHNMRGLSWFYNAGFPVNLYRRWLGLRVNNDGGEEFETVVDPSGDEKTPGTMRGGEGRMCLPPMLLHPVKEVELPVTEEVNREEERVEDAAA